MKLQLTLFTFTTLAMAASDADFGVASILRNLISARYDVHIPVAPFPQVDLRARNPDRMEPTGSLD